MRTLILFILSCILQAALSQEHGWWLKTKGRWIHTAEDLDTLIDANPGKFIMIDFY